MAIKAISQLDIFDNSNTNAASYASNTNGAAKEIGGCLKWIYNTYAEKVDNKNIDEDTLTKFKHNISVECEHKNFRYITDVYTLNNANCEVYPYSLFEISRPLKGGVFEDGANSEWDTFKITYKQLVQNIIDDTLVYLDYKHQLSNFNFYALVGDTQNPYCFYGDKYFDNNLSIHQNISCVGDSYLSGDSYINGSVSVDTNLSVKGKAEIGTGPDSYLYVNGNITCYGNVEVTANHAKWSDLAEYYLADKQYEPGTLVRFGGENEITQATINEVNGVVTSKPAFLMNYELKNNKLGVPIALVGRVPVKVIGKVKKFDKLVSAGEYARVFNSNIDKNKIIIARALENNVNETVKLVECIVKFSL